MIYKNHHQAYLEMALIDQNNHELIKKAQASELMILWFQEDGNQMIIDNIHYEFSKNDILFLTEFHQVECLDLRPAKLIKWNQFFYCIVNHDSDVGCKGVLFYGATCLPFISPDSNSINSLGLMWSLLEIEMQRKDDLQEEGLQVSLKKILVFCTRIYREQIKNEHEGQDEHDFDLVRNYHFLVENHFKVKHAVSDYADLLNKSPKTLSNLFKKLGRKSPIEYIKARRTLEAKRLLSYSRLSVSEIGFELGFPDIQAFSRFFKRETGHSPNKYKLEREKLPSIEETRLSNAL